MWSVLVQHPTVTVGTAPNQAQSALFPPQPRKKGRKSKDDQEAPQVESVAKLGVIEDARTRSLDDVVNDFGDAVRIAVDPETCFVFITGSHARVSAPPLALSVKFLTYVRFYSHRNSHP